MRCKTAIRLITLQQEDRLFGTQARRLQSHLEMCPRCRAYQLGASDLLAALHADAEQASDDAVLSPGFHDALHRRLIEADRATAKRPVAVLDRFLTWLIPPRAARALAAVALFAALALVSGAQILKAPDLPARECQLGHIQSLRVQISPGGRVYASLGSQSALSRRVSEERLP